MEGARCPHYYAIDGSPREAPTGAQTTARPSTGAFAGIVAGVLVVAVTNLMHLSIGQLFPFLPASLKDVNIGFLALGLNVLVLVLVSAFTQPQAAAAQSHPHPL
jgi:Na+/proline symporter